MENIIQLKVDENYELTDSYGNKSFAGKYLGEVNKKVRGNYVGGSASMLFNITDVRAQHHPLWLINAKFAIVRPSVMYLGKNHTVKTILLVNEYLDSLKSEQVVTEYVLKEDNL